MEIDGVDERVLGAFVASQLDGDRRLFLKLFGAFSMSLGELVSSGNKKDADLTKLGGLAHKALAGADAFGAVTIAKKLRDLEERARAKDLRTVEGLFIEIVDLKERTCARIESVAQAFLIVEN